MLKKMVSAILAVMLLAGCVLCGGAEEKAEIPGALDMPYAGLRYTPPEAFRDTAGQIATDGAIELLPGIYYAYWLYCPMTADELTAVLTDPNSAAGSLVAEPLFYVFSIGDGQSFDDMNSMIGNQLASDDAREIGKTGEYTFYVYMQGPSAEFAETIDAAYAEEYTALAGLTDQVIGAFEYYEPLDRFASLIGSKAAFTTTDLSGSAVSSAELFAQNEITMVNIWATWCGPCIRELAELQQIHLRIQEKGCGVVGLLADNDLDAANRLVSEHGVAYPVILAPENFDEIFPITAYPTTFFVGRDGSILSAPVVGAYVDKYENELNALLQPQE